MDTSTLLKIAGVWVFPRSGLVQHEFYGFSRNLPVVIAVGDNGSIPLCDAYANMKKGDILALFDSHNHLEIAENQGSAAARLGIAAGDMILLRSA